ncbi:hypothetical protein RhiirA4_465616 [Rhizophagus irregularis]|uniref:Uncharacterized protein n=1 Tax=Rhizophagus irregularis TaxID=588596 RepID=A0A2I1GSE7_9GLOM|nr:hypothetical protein RhiirA4_465616 [Rhizophagus irregularis]
MTKSMKNKWKVQEDEIPKDTAHNNNAHPSLEDERFVEALTNNESCCFNDSKNNKDKAKEKVVDSESEKLNENKKHVVTIQEEGTTLIANKSSIE